MADTPDFGDMLSELISPKYKSQQALPPEYQSQLDDIQRKQQLAQFLQQKSMGLQGPAPVGRIAPKISMFTGLANAGMGALGGIMAGNGIQDAADVRSKYAADSQADAQKMFSLPTLDAQAQYAATSPFDMTKAAAAQRQKMKMAQAKEASGVLAGAGAVQPALDVINSSDSSIAKAPERKEPFVKWVKDPGDVNGLRQIPEYHNFDDKGVEHVTPGAPNISVATNLPSKEGEMAQAREQEELGAAKGKAQAAMGTLATMHDLTDSLQQGAAVGGGAEQMQNVRKFAQMFGVNFDATGPTDAAMRQLGENLIAHAKTLGANPTNKEDEIIKGLVGTINTDPTALQQIIARMTAMSHKALQDYGDFVDTKKQGQAAKQYPQLYDTAMNGIRTPNELFGPSDLQFQTIEQLRRQGGDITRFKDPTGQPFDPAASFNFPPAAIKPTGSAAQPTPAVAPAGVKQPPAPLSPEKRKEFEDIKARLKARGMLPNGY